MGTYIPCQVEVLEQERLHHVEIYYWIPLHHFPPSPHFPFSDHLWTLSASHLLKHRSKQKNLYNKKVRIRGSKYSSTAECPSCKQFKLNAREGQVLIR